MRRSAILLAVLLTATAVGHCKAKLVASVTNPAYTGHHFRKVLVIGMSNNPAIRSDFEDAMARPAGTRRRGGFPGYPPAAAGVGRRWR